MNINWDDTFHINPHTLQPDTKGIPLPSYGNYGGPTISGPDAPLDLLDTAFAVHDAGSVVDPVAADVQLIDTILALDTAGQLSDPEASLYAGFATLGIVGDLALRGSLDQLDVPLNVVLADAVSNIEEGLAGVAPQEVRGLHAACHFFDKQLGDLLV
jgi:hypothetical protein